MDYDEDYTASQLMNHSPETSLNPTADDRQAPLSTSRHGKVGLWARVLQRTVIGSTPLS